MMTKPDVTFETAWERARRMALLVTEWIAGVTEILVVFAPIPLSGLLSSSIRES